MAIPVIVDTDIGLDVDDVWALVFLLGCPELDVRLITTCTGDTHYRAAVAAKVLEQAGRTDIPIGIGVPLDASPKTHSEWLGAYDLQNYPGRVFEDGVGALCEVAADSDEPVTVIGIGPLPNVAAALARSPALTTNSRFIGMHGSLRKGYPGMDRPAREYNVKMHALSCQAVFEASWERLITPLDTCASVVLEEAHFERVRKHANNLGAIAVANHDHWAHAVREWPMMRHLDPTRQSSILYDTAAVCLAFDESYFEIETLPVRVTDDGATLIDPEHKHLSRCATGWHSHDAFLDFLTDRLTHS